MTSNKRYRGTAALVASLFLLTTLGAIAGSAVMDPVIHAPDYLTTVFSHAAAMTTGTLFWLVNDIGIVFIGLLMFPILRKRSESMALAYVSMRMFECLFMSVGIFFAMLLIPLSREAVRAGAATASLAAMGLLLKQGETWFVDIMQLLFLGLGGVIFTSLLYRTRLVPRFIALVGVVGYSLLLPDAILSLYGVISPSHGGSGSLLAIPVALFEVMLMPAWLYAKGFDTARLEAGEAERPSRGYAVGTAES